jgi:hypothetical protein
MTSYNAASLPNLGDMVRVINETRATYKRTGFVHEVRDCGTHRDVVVTIAGCSYVYELNEIEKY